MHISLLTLINTGFYNKKYLVFVITFPLKVVFIHFKHKIFKINYVKSVKPILIIMVLTDKIYLILKSVVLFDSLKKLIFDNFKFAINRSVTVCNVQFCILLGVEYNNYYCDIG